MKLSGNGRDKLCRYIPIPAPDRRSESGFTFVELMIALVLSIIIMTPLFKLLIDQQKTYTVQSQMTNMRQNARIGLDIMTKELRMAGYGIPLSTWSDSPASPTRQPAIYPTPNATSITFYCNLEGVKTVLSADEAVAETQLSVESPTTDFAVNDIVYIEGPDDASPRTTHWHSSTISAKTSNTITINNGLNFKYLKGSTIHLRNTITYTFYNSSYGLTADEIKKRNKIYRTKSRTLSAGTEEELAYDIQNMTLNYTFEDNGTGLPNDGDQATDTTNDTDDIRMINVSITAQTKNKDPFLNTNRTTTFTSDVTLVNTTY